MTDFLIGYVVATGAGLADDPGLKASRQSTGGALSIFETSIGAGPPLHVHDRDDESFMCWTARCLSAAGTKRSTPRRAASCSRPVAARTASGPRAPAARLLLIAVPGGIEDYFREINAASGDDERTRIGERYGIRVVPG